MLNGIDLSNLNGHPDTWPSQPWYPVYQAAQFVIVQAIEPPPGFPGADVIDPETGKRGYTGAQLRQVKADGKYALVYAWLWNGLADTRASILARLATVPPSVQLDGRPWVDVEDTTPVAGVVSLAGIESAKQANPRLARQLQCETRPAA